VWQPEAATAWHQNADTETHRTASLHNAPACAGKGIRVKKRYKLMAGWAGEISVTVEVDHDVLTPEVAKEINDFWTSAEEVLAAANDDIVLAAVRRAAPYLIGAVLEGSNLRGAQAELDEAEGWPAKGAHGITIVDFEVPDMGSIDLEMEEVTA
jgi:hypothetical protein